MVGQEEQLATSIASAIAMAIRPLQKRLAALEARVTVLEARPVPREHKGVWRTDQAYERGDWVTHAGSTWYATVNSYGQRPGETSGWLLTAKRGADGKDAR
jgi:hypothetical protein